MKKTIFTLLALLCSASVFAQSNELAEKVASLEGKVSTLEHAITSMQTKVDEVTRQNLALKQAISLQPTISECTTESGINYRLIEAKGNRQTGKISLIFSVLNTTKRDLSSFYKDTPTIIDEKGYRYTDKEFEKVSMGNSGISYVTLMPDTPVEMKVIFISETEPQYVKTFNLSETLGGGDNNFRMANIPIKWE